MLKSTDRLRRSKSSAVVFFPMNQRGELCLSAVPGCWEKAQSIFNSQPIFCPSHHFIPILKLSSGPHTVTFWHVLQPTSTMPANTVSSSTPPTQSIFNMNGKSSLIEHPAFLPTPVWYVWLQTNRGQSGLDSRQIRPYQVTQAVFQDYPTWGPMLIIMSAGGRGTAWHAQRWRR